MISYNPVSHLARLGKRDGEEIMQFKVRYTTFQDSEIHNLSIDSFFSTHSVKTNFIFVSPIPPRAVFSLKKEKAVLGVYICLALIYHVCHLVWI